MKLTNEIFMKTYVSINKLTTLNGNEKLYIHEVLSFQLTNKECWYSNTDMAELIGLQVRGLNKLQAKLLEKGYITIEIITEGNITKGKKILVTQKLFDEANAIETKVKKIKPEAKPINLSNDKVKDEPTTDDVESDVEEDEEFTGEITSKHILIKITKSEELKEDDEKTLIKYIEEDSIRNTDELNELIDGMKRWY